MLFLFSSARKRASEGFGVALAIHGAAMDCQCDTKTLRGPLAGRGKQKQHLLNID